MKKETRNKILLRRHLYYEHEHGKIFCHDRTKLLKLLPSESVNCCVTSPPYWGLRDYEEEGQLGQEPTFQEFIKNLTVTFREFRRVLRKDGVLWIIIGDSYNGSGKGAGTKKSKAKHVYVPPNNTKITRDKNLKIKDLVGIPWRMALALQDDGWYLRQDNIWHKPNAMPESVKDRCTNAHEYIFHFSKSAKYWFDYKAIKEPCSEANIKDFQRRKTFNNKSSGDKSYEVARKDLSGSREQYMPKDFMRNKRSVWKVNTVPYKGAHFAPFPPKLILPMILAGCREGGVVLDMFFGTGTTGEVAIENNRQFIGIDLSKKYCQLAKERIKKVVNINRKPLF